MAKSTKKTEGRLSPLAKTPTGIAGFDEITFGGLPAGRPSLVCGEAGCGKTLFAIEFIVKGAVEYNEPGVFVTFEEKAEELTANVASLGFDLQQLIKKNQLKIDYVHIDRSEIEETGEYDLNGLFVRLGHAIDTIGAKRVVLDTIENLFMGLENKGILRAELRRLFQWLKEKKVTTVITGEKGDGTLTREGLEEYVSDCVILLDNRVANQIATRRLRIVKYRGSLHGSNEYPFLIDEDGISVLPVTSLKLEAQVSAERISTGIASLDEMLDGKGFYKGSSVLVSGTSGTGKTSIAASFAAAACKRNERCIYFAFEESPEQIVRNMRSIGMDLNKYVQKGLLMFQAARPTMHGLEMHLVVIHKLIKKFKPSCVIIDPITNLVSVGSVSEIQSILTRLIDFLQSQQISVLFTALTPNTIIKEQTDETISSLVDAWVLVRDIEMNGERNRGLYIMKSRGMKHSNQVREFLITSNGLNLVDVYLGGDGVLTGSAREAHQLQKHMEEILQKHSLGRNDKAIERKTKELEIRIQSLQSEFDAAREELKNDFVELQLTKEVTEKNRKELMRRRDDANPGTKKVVQPDKNKRK
jgi:circadian clock protein KaiC